MQEHASDITDKYSLETIVKGIAQDLVDLRAGKISIQDAQDLVDLRAGKISIQDAQARALLAKRYMNGVRLVLNARNSLELSAQPVPATLTSKGD